jgi:hypothetical protein
MTSPETLSTPLDEAYVSMQAFVPSAPVMSALPSG